MPPRQGEGTNHHLLPNKISNMAAKILLAALAAAAVVELSTARPDAPSSSYLPPARGNRPSSSYGAPSFSGSSGTYGAPGFGGGGGGYDDKSEPAHYQFQYEVDAPEYGTQFGHQENRDGDVARGTYHVLLPDGRVQTVQYEADQNGYRPQISYKDTGRGYAGGGAGGAAGGGNGGYRY